MTWHGFLNIVGPVGHNVIFLLVGGKVCDGIYSFIAGYMTELKSECVLLQSTPLRYVLLL